MTKIKICGCRTPADIQHAADAGADFVGMVVAEKTKRYVPTEDRPSLVAAATRDGRSSVGTYRLVFSATTMPTKSAPASAAC